MIVTAGRVNHRFLIRVTSGHAGKVGGHINGFICFCRPAGMCNVRCHKKINQSFFRLRYPVTDGVALLSNRVFLQERLYQRDDLCRRILKQVVAGIIEWMHLGMGKPPLPFGQVVGVKNKIMTSPADQHG